MSEEAAAIVPLPTIHVYPTVNGGEGYEKTKDKEKRR